LLVSIVIPAYNAADTLGQCLQACLSQTYPHVEVIVVDDGSTDGTAKIAASYRVRYVSQDNRGPAAARNHGARLANGEIVAFTDADCVPGRKWIANLLRGLDDGVVGVGSTYGIANSDNVLARIIHAEIQDRHERLDERVDFLGSFNVAYRKRAFDAVGGFDESFTTASGEDNDLAYRLADRGGALRFVKDAPVAHYHPARLWPYLRTQMHHGYWRMKLYARHPGRAGGDNYAPFGDLAATPLSALALISGVLTILLQFLTLAHRAVVPLALTAAAVFACSLLVYAAIRVPMAVRMMRKTEDRSMIFYVDVAFLRDLARCAGMVGGLWRFFIRRNRG